VAPTLHQLGTPPPVRIINGGRPRPLPPDLLADRPGNDLRLEY
jgi:hypothetical protein